MNFVQTVAELFLGHWSFDRLTPLIGKQIYVTVVDEKHRNSSDFLDSEASGLLKEFVRGGSLEVTRFSHVRLVKVIGIT